MIQVSENTVLRIMKRFIYVYVAGFYQGWLVRFATRAGEMRNEAFFSHKPPRKETILETWALGKWSKVGVESIHLA